MRCAPHFWHSPIAKPVRPFWSHLRSQRDKLYPVSDLVAEQGLGVKVEQCIESGSRSHVAIDIRAPRKMTHWQAKLA